MTKLKIGDKCRFTKKFFAYNDDGVPVIDFYKPECILTIISVSKQKEYNTKYNYVQFRNNLDPNNGIDGGPDYILELIDREKEINHPLTSIFK